MIGVTVADDFLIYGYIHVDILYYIILYYIVYYILYIIYIYRERDVERQGIEGDVWREGGGLFLI